MDVVNPSTGIRIRTYEQHTWSGVTETLDRATEIFDDWRTRSVRDCEQLLAAAGEVLRDNNREYAESFGIDGYRPESRADLQKVITSAVGGDMALVEVPIE